MNTIVAYQTDNSILLTSELEHNQWVRLPFFYNAAEFRWYRYEPIAKWTIKVKVK